MRTGSRVRRFPRGGEAPRLRLFAGHDDPLCDESGLDGWSAVTTGPVRRRTFPGGHFCLVDQQRDVVADVAATPARNPVTTASP